MYYLNRKRDGINSATTVGRFHEEVVLHILTTVLFVDRFVLQTDQFLKQREIWSRLESYFQKLFLCLKLGIVYGLSACEELKKRSFIINITEHNIVNRFVPSQFYQLLL